MISLAEAAGLARSVAVYHGRPWRAARLRRFYAGLVSPGDFVFDIGAHVGNRSRALARLGARVVAVEPQPLFATFLRWTLPSGVILVEQAVAASPGRATLAVSSRHPTVSTLSEGWIETVSATDGFAGVAWDGRVEVEVTTLDLLVAEYGEPRFVKIDVEGLEAEILKGLSRPLGIIAFEYVPAALEVAEECLAVLGALGDYRFNRVVGEGYRFAAGWSDAPTLVGDLRRVPPDGASGDVYAVRADVTARLGL